MGAKVKFGRKIIVSAAVEVVRHVAAHTGFYKPGVLVFAVKAQGGGEPQHGHALAASVVGFVRVPGAQTHVPVCGHGVAPPVGVPVFKRNGRAQGVCIRIALCVAGLHVQGRGLAHVSELGMGSAGQAQQGGQRGGGNQGSVSHAFDGTQVPPWLHACLVMVLWRARLGLQVIAVLCTHHLPLMALDSDRALGIKKRQASWRFWVVLAALRLLLGLPKVTYLAFIGSSTLVVARSAPPWALWRGWCGLPSCWRPSPWRLCIFRVSASKVFCCAGLSAA